MNNNSKIKEDGGSDRIEGGVIFLNADGYFPKSVVFLEKDGKYQEYRIIRSKNRRFQLSK